MEAMRKAVTRFAIEHNLISLCRAEQAANPDELGTTS